MWKPEIGSGSRRYRRTRLNASLSHETAERVIAFAHQLDIPLGRACEQLIEEGLSRTTSTQVGIGLSCARAQTGSACVGMGLEEIYQQEEK